MFHLHQLRVLVIVVFCITGFVDTGETKCNVRMEISNGIIHFLNDEELCRCLGYEPANLTNAENNYNITCDIKTLDDDGIPGVSAESLCGCFGYKNISDDSVKSIIHLESDHHIMKTTLVNIITERLEPLEYETSTAEYGNFTSFISLDSEDSYDFPNETTYDDMTLHSLLTTIKEPKEKSVYNNVSLESNYNESTTSNIKEFPIFSPNLTKSEKLDEDYLYEDIISSTKISSVEILNFSSETPLDDKTDSDINFKSSSDSRHVDNSSYALSSLSDITNNKTVEKMANRYLINNSVGYNNTTSVIITYHEKTTPKTTSPATIIKNSNDDAIKVTTVNGLITVKSSYDTAHYVPSTKDNVSGNASIHRYISFDRIRNENDTISHINSDYNTSIVKLSIDKDKYAITTTVKTEDTLDFPSTVTESVIFAIRSTYQPVISTKNTGDTRNLLRPDSEATTMNYKKDIKNYNTSNLLDIFKSIVLANNSTMGTYAENMSYKEKDYLIDDEITTKPVAMLLNNNIITKGNGNLSVSSFSSIDDEDSNYSEESSGLLDYDDKINLHTSETDTIKPDIINTSPQYKNKENEKGDNETDEEKENSRTNLTLTKADTSSQSKKSSAIPLVMILALSCLIIVSSLFIALYLYFWFSRGSYTLHPTSTSDSRPDHVVEMGSFRGS